MSHNLLTIFYVPVSGRADDAPLLFDRSDAFPWREADRHRLGTAAAPAGQTSDAALELPNVNLVQVVNVEREPFIRAAKCP